MKKFIKRIFPIVIVVMIIIIIGIIIAIHYFNNNKHLFEDNNPEPTSPEEIEVKTRVEETVVPSEYFIVKNIVTQYYNYCKQLNTSEKDLDIYRLPLTEQEMEEYIKKGIEEKEQFAQEAIYNMLDKKYIDEFQITEDNIGEKFTISNRVENVIKKMYTIQNSNNVSTYFISGMYVDTTESKKEDFYIAISLDMLNNTFTIYPQEYCEKYEYDKLNIGEKLEIPIESIDNKNYNKFEYKVSIEDSEIAKEYFNNYRYSMLYDTNYAYDMLDKEYREKRFGNIDNYINYVKENYSSLEKCIVSQYQITESNGLKKYICLGNYENYYIFIQKNISNYSLSLDTYTIELEEFSTKYNNGDQKTKAGMNVEKFFEALNRKDYTYIYEHLADSFKNNSHQKQEDFEKYIKENLFEYNDKEYTNYEQEGNLHVFKISVSNKENEKQKKTMTIIIQLKEGTDFVMSFSIE